MSTLTLYYKNGSTQQLNLHDSFFTKTNKHGQQVKRHPGEVMADAGEVAKGIGGKHLLRYGLNEETPMDTERIKIAKTGKTAEEKQELKSAKQLYKLGMRTYYGKDWRKGGHNNVPIKAMPMGFLASSSVALVTKS